MPFGGSWRRVLRLFGRVKFLTSGIHVSVRTINPSVTDEHLLALAATVLPKLQG